ncbi:MAG: phosphate/phosphite/phosphonate ABC transporter substrate-binding protein [Hydrogenophaga sp.]
MSAGNTPLVLGVVPQLPALEVFQRWSPMGHAIERECGQKVELRHSASIPAFEADFSKGTFDLAYMNPYHAVMAQRAQQYVPLVRDDRERLKGVLVVARSSPYRTPKDLQNQTIAFPSPNAFGASLLMRATLDRDEGIRFTPNYVKTHSNAYRHVLTGQAAAAGGVRSTLDREPASLQAELRVLFETPSFMPHPLSAHPRVPQAIRDCVQNTVLNSTAALLQAVQMPQPVRADYARDYAPLERLSLEAFVVNAPGP